LSRLINKLLTPNPRDRPAAGDIIKASNKQRLFPKKKGGEDFKRENQAEKLNRIDAEQPKKEREIKIHVENVPRRRDFPEFNLLDREFGKLKLNDHGFKLPDNDFFNDFGFESPILRNPGRRKSPGYLDIEIDGRNRRHSDIDMIPAARNIYDMQYPEDHHATYDGPIKAKHEKHGILRKVSNHILEKAPQPIKGCIEEGKKFIQNNRH